MKEVLEDRLRDMTAHPQVQEDRRPEQEDHHPEQEDRRREWAIRVKLVNSEDAEESVYISVWVDRTQIICNNISMG